MFQVRFLMINLMALSVFLLAIPLKAQKDQTVESPLMSAKEKEIQTRAKKKLFPGGKDEESLKVQVQLPQSIRKMVPDDTEGAEDDFASEPSAED